MRGRLIWVGALAATVLVAIAAYLIVAKPDGEQNIGAGVKVESTQLRNNLHATVTDATLPFTSEVIQPISKLYQIGPSGPLPALMTVRLPLLEKATLVTDDALITIYTAETADGEWIALPTAIAADGMSAIAHTVHLSFFIAVRTWIGRQIGKAVDRAKSILGALKTVFDGMTSDVFADAVQPSCANTGTANSNGYSAQQTGAKKAVLWCFGMEKGKRVVTVVNNRRYPLLVNHSGMQVVEDGPAFQFRLSQLAKAVSGKGTVVFPRETAVFSVELPDKGGEAHISTELDGRAQSLYALETGVRLALLLLTNFGAGSGVASNGAIKASMPTIDLMDKLLQDASCLGAVTDTMLNIGKLFATCFTPTQIMYAFGKAAVFLAAAIVVAPVVAYFQSEFNSLGDMFNSRDKQQITIKRTNIAQLCPTGQANCFGPRQADIDGDGQLDSVSLVFDPDYQDVRQFTARVVFSTGEVTDGWFGFPNPARGKADPVAMKFSFQGFAEMNGEPGLEIFGRVFVNEDWYIVPLKFLSKEARLEIVGLGGGHDFSLGLNTPFAWDETYREPNFSGGFRCGKSPRGEHQFIVWQIETVTYNDRSIPDEYVLSEQLYEREGTTHLWYQVYDRAIPKPLLANDISAPQRLIAQQRAKGSCEGLGALPVR